MKKNYVKGEWRLNNYHHPYQYIVAHGGPEDNDAFPGQRKICDIWDWNTEKGKANAHLIISAPTLKQQRNDLLAACEELVDIVDNSPEDIDSFTTQPAKAAIAKVKEGKV